MKRIIVLFFVLLLNYLQTFAQESNKLESFKGTTLMEYSNYFLGAELAENDQLSLSASDKYQALNITEKRTMMSSITASWRAPIVLVRYGTKSELWGWNGTTGNTQLLDEWDLNAPRLVKPVQTFTRPHPWFFYVGAQLGGDSQNNINMAFNTRVGFFLLLNRWDMAASVSAGLTGNANGTPSSYSNLGFMSRVHFPIRKLNISPNIGGEIAYSVYSGSPPDVTASLVLGFRWYIGIGSLDIGVKIGKITSGMGGYTMTSKSK